MKTPLGLNYVLLLLAGSCLSVFTSGATDFQSSIINVPSTGDGSSSSDRFRRSLAAKLFSEVAPSGGGGGGSCAGQSEISESTIIRTKDSRVLGAKFLNETSFGPNSRVQCLAACCAFRGCNVAVYEEKVSQLRVRLETATVNILKYEIITSPVPSRSVSSLGGRKLLSLRLRFGRRFPMQIHLARSFHDGRFTGKFP